jgi:probable F420-dependent oxidoreductase
VKIGLLMNVSPRNWLPFAQAAESAGFDSVWIGEHLIFPEKVVGNPGSHHDDPAIASDVPLYDPWVQLAYLAGQTKSIRLGTNVYNIGLRHPFITARALMTTDLISNGRIEFGIGVSWLQAEWDAMGLPFDSRGRRADEIIHVIKRLFTEDVVSHKGEFFSFGPVKFQPKPIQSPWPPFLIGGNSKAALRRAALAGDGWIPMPESFDILGANIKQIALMRADAGRTQPFSVTIISPEQTPSYNLLRSYQDIGVTRVIIIPWTHPRDGVHSIQRFGDEVIPLLV